MAPLPMPFHTHYKRSWERKIHTVHIHTIATRAIPKYIHCVVECWGELIFNTHIQ